jgi:hypothetical protein
MTEQALQGLQIVVRYPDGRSEKLVIDADSIVVGSGAHCEVRLPSEHAAIEHVSLTLAEGGVHARARSFDPNPTINGVGFTQTPVLPESVIGIGRVELTVASVDVLAGEQVIKKQEQKTSPLTYLLGVVALALAVYLILSPKDSTAIQASPAAPPDLWVGQATICPQQARDAALAIAVEKLGLAEGKRERSPFHVEDGVAAVPLFETASACFKIGVQSASADDAARSAQLLRTKVNEDYRLHQVRLEHAITVKDWDTAQREATVLLAFTRGKQGPYVLWLANLQHKLMLQASAKDKKEKKT